MRMKFFEKTYLSVFILFLFFLNSGVFALAFYTHQNSISAAESVCSVEFQSIAKAFEKDLDYAGIQSAKILQTAYGKFYNEKGIKLRFVSDGEITYSAISGSLSVPTEGKISGGKLDGKRYILISGFVCDGTMTMVYAKDVSYLDTEFRNLSAVFVVWSLIASLLLGIILYFILRKLYLPITKLRKATGEIAKGDFNVRAQVKGDDEISALAMDFNIMADKVSRQIEQLKETADHRQRMLDNLAHEMRTPLTAIHGYAEYINSAKISEEEKTESAEYIISESKRLKEISEILLDTAFIRENSIRNTEVNIKSVTKSVFLRLNRSAKEKGVLLVDETENISVLGDKTLLELLVSNLTENAIKACAESGTVIVGAMLKEEKVCLFIRDNGVGMLPDQICHITEPFYRTDKSRSRKEGGTGLGLALCKQIAISHGTELIFDSVYGKGTTVCINLTPFLQPPENIITNP